MMEVKQMSPHLLLFHISALCITCLQNKQTTYFVKVSTVMQTYFFKGLFPLHVPKPVGPVKSKWLINRGAGYPA